MWHLIYDTWHVTCDTWRMVSHGLPSANDSIHRVWKIMLMDNTFPADIAIIWLVMCNKLFQSKTDAISMALKMYVSLLNCARIAFVTLSLLLHLKIIYQYIFKYPFFFLLVDRNLFLELTELTLPFFCIGEEHKD